MIYSLKPIKMFLSQFHFKLRTTAITSTETKTLSPLQQAICITIWPPRKQNTLSFPRHFNSILKTLNATLDFNEKRLTHASYAITRKPVNNITWLYLVCPYWEWIHTDWDTKNEVEARLLTVIDKLLCKPYVV